MPFKPQSAQRLSKGRKEMENCCPPVKLVQPVQLFFQKTLFKLKNVVYLPTWLNYLVKPDG
jgi:hypothetical protein